MVDPEKITDVDEGTGSDLGIDGMSADERAAWDAMQAGRDLPAPVVGEGDGASGDGDAVDDGDPGDDLSADDGVVAGDDKGEPAAGEKRIPPKTISYGKYQRKLKEANDTAAALQAKLDGATAETKKEREERLRLDERTKMLLDAISAKPKAEEKPVTETDPEPDGEDDPIAHAAWTSRELKRTQKIVQDIQSGNQKRETQTAAQNEEQQLYNTYESDLKREAAIDTTFPEAFNHLRESRYTELGFIYAGIDINDKAQVDATLTPEQQGKLAEDIQRSFHNEQMLVAREALSKGKSPAKVVANLARARGWKPGATPVPAKQNGSGQPVVPAKVTERPTVKDELAAIRAGQEASKSLSDAGGSPGGDITPERIANMSEDEFQEFYDSMPKNKLDKLMGKTLQ